MALEAVEVERVAENFIGLDDRIVLLEVPAEFDVDSLHNKAFDIRRCKVDAAGFQLTQVSKAAEQYHLLQPTDNKSNSLKLVQCAQKIEMKLIKESEQFSTDKSPKSVIQWTGSVTHTSEVGPRPPAGEARVEIKEESLDKKVKEETLDKKRKKESSKTKRKKHKLVI